MRIWRKSRHTRTSERIKRKPPCLGRLEEGRYLPIRLYCAWARVGSGPAGSASCRGGRWILGSWAAESVLSLLVVCIPWELQCVAALEPAPPAPVALHPLQHSLAWASQGQKLVQNQVAESTLELVRWHHERFEAQQPDGGRFGLSSGGPGFYFQ